MYISLSNRDYGSFDSLSNSMLYLQQ